MLGLLLYRTIFCAPPKKCRGSADRSKASNNLRQIFSVGTVECDETAAADELLFQDIGASGGTVEYLPIIFYRISTCTLDTNGSVRLHLSAVRPTH